MDELVRLSDGYISNPADDGTLILRLEMNVSADGPTCRVIYEGGIPSLPVSVLDIEMADSVMPDERFAALNEVLAEYWQKWYGYQLDRLSEFIHPEGDF